MSKKSFIDSVKVGSPCSEDWNDMKGNVRVRFCSHCAKNVNDLSTMTRKEATRLVRKSGGDLCIRYIVDPRTQRPMFAEQLLQITRRTPGLAAGVLTASTALSTQAYAQGGISLLARDPVVSVKKEQKQAPTNTSGASVAGTVVDANEAVVAGAKIAIINTETNVSRSTTTNDEGEYHVGDLPTAKYRVEIESPGFQKFARDIDLSDAVTAKLRTTLEVGMALGGVAVMVEYSSPLSIAISDEDVDAVRELLTQGVNVNAKEQEYSKITPLFVAVEHGDVNVVQMLLAYGARPNARDSEKRTPLWRLDEESTAELVGVLLRSGAKANLTDKEGNTVLISLAGDVKPGVLQALVDAGVDIDHANNEGWTALMQASETGETENVRILLIAGAFVNARDKDGDTALDMADNDEIRELLRTYGAVGKEPKPDDN